MIIFIITVEKGVCQYFDTHQNQIKQVSEMKEPGARASELGPKKLLKPVIIIVSHFLSLSSSSFMTKYVLDGKTIKQFFENP